MVSIRLDFQRTLNQGEALDEVLSKIGLNLNRVVNLDVGKEILIEEPLEEEYVKIVGKFFILNLIHLKKRGSL